MILSSIIILGILSQWLAWRLKLPAILPLILVGLFVGPFSTLYTTNGEKLIEPIWDGTNGLFPEDAFFSFVSLSICIILFEGGLTLKRIEVKNVSAIILRLITLGTLITFIGGGVACHYLFDLSWSISFLFAALITVTGPTVITPILRNIPVKKDISAVLKWESILIDPIGALIAVLVFEFINIDTAGHFSFQVFIDFIKFIFTGVCIGFSSAYGFAFIINKKWVPHYLLNVFSLCAVLLVFVFSDYMVHESGLLAVVIMGMVIGNLNLPNIQELLYFKESLSVMLISILFILLSANINIEDLRLLFNIKTVYLFLIIIFLLRPIGVIVSSINSNLKLNEKLFISWVGPRGIIAAGISSLFGLKLLSQNVKGAEYLTPLVFMTVLGTVLLNATTARLFAKLSNVFQRQSNGILIIGCSELSRIIAFYLHKNEKEVVLLDTNQENIRKAKEIGLTAINSNIFSDDLNNYIELNNIGVIFALNPNVDINNYALNKFKKQFGENGAFRLLSQKELKSKHKDVNASISINDTYTSLCEIIKTFPTLNELIVSSENPFHNQIELFKKREISKPLFVEIDSMLVLPLCSINESQIPLINKILYIGKPLEMK